MQRSFLLRAGFREVYVNFVIFCYFFAALPLQRGEKSPIIGSE